MEGNSTAMLSYHQVTQIQAPGISTNKETKEVLYHCMAHGSPPEENTTQRVRRAAQHVPVVLPSFINRRSSASLNHHGGLSATSTAIAVNPLPLYDTVPPIMEVPHSNGSLYLFSSLPN
eukprot:6166585-Ditylum_brightwellii.AAC.1